jgi:cardiolipin synthase
MDEGLYATLTGSTVYFVGEWVVRVVMLIVITRRKNPTSAMAWLLVIFFLPYPGFLLYLVLGTHRLPEKRKRQYRQMLEEKQGLWDRFAGHPNIVRPDLDERLEMAVKLAQELGDMPILGGNDVAFYTDTKGYLGRIVQDIDAAESTVHVLFYIWGTGETGRQVADALIRAALRGVKCRVLVDASGSAAMYRNWAGELRKAGVEINEALPVGIFRRRAARFDLRNHRKLVVIDGRIAFTGSHNCIEPSYGHKDMAWHDLSVRMTGPAVLTLQAMFISDWYFETDELLMSDDVAFPDPEIKGDIPAQAVPSGPIYPIENYQRLIVAAIHAARSRVTMTTPYFVPDEAFLQAIQTAVLRGVEVELIVPEVSDQIIVGAASRAYYDDMLDAGANVYLYKAGLMHAKTMRIDNQMAFIGTSNFDIRSFELNFEINVVFYCEAVTARLRRVHEMYIERSFPLEQAIWDQRPMRRRVFQNIARLMSPLL